MQKDAEQVGGMEMRGGYRFFRCYIHDLYFLTPKTYNLHLEIDHSGKGKITDMNKDNLAHNNRFSKYFP